jgi:hypothetical protein
MKKILTTSALATSLILGMATISEAKTKVHIYFGIPHYSYQVGPDYRYRDGYGWYNSGGDYSDDAFDGAYNDGPRFYEGPQYRMREQSYGNRISCGEAKGIVRGSGFRNVSAVECDGRTYTFRAMRRGNMVTVYVNSRTGAVSRG